jgi:hypothetical protein
MRKVYDVVATVGKRKDGKNNYVKVGVVLEGDKGLSMKLESIPCGNEWNGWLNFYEPKARNDAPQANTQSEPPPGDFDDKIPF